MIIKLEQNEIKNNGAKVFNALPAGQYNGEVEEIKVITTSTNRPMLEMIIKLNGDKSYMGAMLDGRREKYRILLDTKYTGTIIFNVLKALNVDVKAGDNIDLNLLVSSNNLISRKCVVVLDKGSYIDKNGAIKETNNVKYIKKFKEKVQEIIVNDDDIPF